MSTLTWLHLSDFHFRTKEEYDSELVLESLLEDIQHCTEEFQLQLDFIFVTGDIAYSGLAQEYELAARFFDQLTQTLNLEKRRILIVPGNHDVDRNAVTPIARNAGRNLSTRKEVSQLLGSPEDVQAMKKRQADFYRFAASYGVTVPEPAALHWAQLFEHPGLTGKLAVIGLNTAWVSESNEDETRGLVIGERQIRTALSECKSAAFKIVLQHHPFELLRAFEKKGTAALLKSQSHCILHGHLHSPDLNLSIGPDSQALLIAGGACYETRDFPNVYNFTELNFCEGTGRVILRAYANPDQNFWAPAVSYYKNAPHGVWNFYFPPHSQLEKTGKGIPHWPHIPIQTRMETRPDEMTKSEILKRGGTWYEVHIYNSTDIHIGDHSNENPQSDSRGDPSLPAPAPEYNLEAVRRMIEALPEEVPLQWSYDAFKELYPRLKEIKTRQERAQALVEYCQENQMLPRLLELTRVNNPILYAEYAGRIFASRPDNQAPGSSG